MGQAIQSGRFGRLDGKERMRSIHLNHLTPRMDLKKSIIWLNMSF